MPVLWNKLQLETAVVLLSQELSGPEESAHFFTQSYITSILIAQDPVNNLVLFNPKKIKKGKKKYNILYEGWLKAFKMMEDSSVDLKMVPYLHVSKALVKFWTGVLVSQFIPHNPSVPFSTYFTPILAPSIILTLSYPLPIEFTNIILFPGNVISVATGIHKAFNMKKEALVAEELVKTYKNHIKSIKGIYSGVGPPIINPNGPPFRGTPTGPIQWSGLK